MRSLPASLCHRKHKSTPLLKVRYRQGEVGERVHECARKKHSTGSSAQPPKPGCIHPEQCYHGVPHGSALLEEAWSG